MPPLSPAFEAPLACNSSIHLPSVPPDVQDALCVTEIGFPYVSVDYFMASFSINVGILSATSDQQKRIRIEVSVSPKHPEGGSIHSQRVQGFFNLTILTQELQTFNNQL